MAQKYIDDKNFLLKIAESNDLYVNSKNIDHQFKVKPNCFIFL